MCTLLIAGRLWYHHRQARKIKALEDTPYSSIITIIVESAALYSLCGIVYIPLVVRTLPAQFPVTALIGSLTAIAPNLIILRMALGTAASSPAEMNTMAFELSTDHRRNSRGHSPTPLPGGDTVWTCEVKSAQLRADTDPGSLA
uniref:N/A n=1 Tax=Ganoderma boninense TaxID=34458 RepID=A0A5K1K9D8_9APHY|nr:N/A [Ganoderma boninense]